MNKDSFENGAGVDVDSLAARIKETARRGSASRQEATAGPAAAEALESVDVGELVLEIHRSGPLSDVINQVPIRSRGWKRGLEQRVKKYLKHLVHWNTRAQADFNRSVIRSLGLIAKKLQSAEREFGDIQDRLKEAEARSAQLSGLRSEIQAVVDQSAEIERKMSREMKRLETASVEKVGHFSTSLEAITRRVDKIAASTADLARQVAQAHEQLRAQRDSDERVSHLSSELQRIGDELERLQASSEKVSQLSAALEDVAARIEAVSAQSPGFEEHFSRKLAEVRGEIDASGEVSRISNDLDMIRMRLLRAERALSAAAQSEAARPTLESDLSVIRNRSRANDTQTNEYQTNGQPRREAVAKRGMDKLQEQGFDYFLFEHRFRGAIPEIKQRQAIYLAHFLGKRNVLDLGCGRGEFVELLTEKGVNVTGVDNSEDIVEFCRDRRLPVVLADMFVYLGNLPDQSVDGIFISQVVEHLSPESIFGLIKLCGRKLAPGGVIVAETVNTNCPAALANFYLDPSHVRPVPSQMLRFMLEQAAFAVESLRFTSPLAADISQTLEVETFELPESVSLYQDYAVVAVKH